MGRRLRLAADLLPPRSHARIAELANAARNAARAPRPAPDPVARHSPPPPFAERRAGRRRRVRLANIVMYHRVGSDAGDPFSLCVTPERFAEHLRVLTSRAEVVPLDAVQPPASAPRVAVTFDDGYADNLLEALPLAERFGVPITVFVASRMLGSTRGFWWDRLARALVRPEQMELVAPLPGGPMAIVTGTDAAAHAALDALRERLLPLPVDEIDAVVGRLCEAAGAEDLVGPPVLTENELRALAGHPLVTIGAHTTNHPLLAGRSPAAQLDTIAASKADLEAMLDVEVRHFAYPFGHRSSFDRRSMGAVARSGFATACSTLRGCVTPWSDPFCLPRRMVKDWDADAFRAELGAWGVP